MKSILHIAHLGTLDAAPLLVAQELGFFTTEGLDVSLSCPLGLAAICARLAEARLAGACLPAHLAVMLSVGAGVTRVPLDVIRTLSWQGIGLVMAPAAEGAPLLSAPLRFGVMAPASCARLFLGKWQQAPTTRPIFAETSLVPVAASQLVEFLREGVIDGFCGHDPLPALAHLRKDATLVADSATLCPMHPGSVLAVRRDLFEGRQQLAAALGRAMQRAREFCADPANLGHVWRLVLAQPPFAGLDPALRAALANPLGNGLPSLTSTRFDGPAASNAPATNGEAFLEAACRSALTPGQRNVDLRSEITRLFRTQPQAANVAS